VPYSFIPQYVFAFAAGIYLSHKQMPAPAATKAWPVQPAGLGWLCLWLAWSLIHFLSVHHDIFVPLHPLEQQDAHVLELVVCIPTADFCCAVGHLGCWPRLLCNTAPHSLGSRPPNPTLHPAHLGLDVLCIHWCLWPSI